jgi:hypothetical protein
MVMRKVQRPPRPTGQPKVQAISKILMAPKQSGPPRKKRPMSPGELKARTGKTVISKRKGKPKFEREKAKPRAKMIPRSVPKPKFKFELPTRDKLKKMADGGDLAKMIKTSGRIGDKDTARANKAIMDFVKKIKPTGRPSDLDVKRAINAFKMARKGQKPVLDSKGKPVKNLTQKAGPGKPMSADQKKQLRRFKDAIKGMPKRPKRKRTPSMMPLMGTAAKGMRKGFGGKNLKSAAKKLKRIM